MGVRTRLLTVLLFATFVVFTHVAVIAIEHLSVDNYGRHGWGDDGMGVIMIWGYSFSIFLKINEKMKRQFALVSFSIVSSCFYKLFLVFL
jgi:hypothetical protein